MSKKEAKTLARKTIAAAESAIASGLSYVDERRRAFEASIARFELLIAASLDEGCDAHTVLGKDWRAWAKQQLPGRSVQTVYRWRNAGRVARVLLGPAVTSEDGTVSYPESLLADVPGALIGSLVPLNRILTSAKTDEDKDKATALVRSTYADLVATCEEDEDEDGRTIRIAPTAEDVLAAAEAVAPTNRGSKATASDADEDEDEDNENENEDENEDESRRESSDTLQTVSAASVEAAAPIVGAIVRQAVDNGTEEATVKGIMLATLRLAEEHGTSVVAAVLSGVSK